MTASEFVIALFALLIAGLLMPLPHGVRMALFLALVALSVMTFLNGGMQSILGVFS